MELYILNSLYQRIGFVENHKSWIWTERFAAWGDFQLTLPSTLENRARFPAGTLLGKSDSSRVMVVETFEDTKDEAGEAVLKLSGRSLEKILEDRLAASGTTGAPWVLTGLPAAVARQIYHSICALGSFNSGDVISGVTEGSFYPDDTLPEPPSSITYSIELMTVYNALKNLCEPYGMGFRLVRNGDTSQLYFDVYMGSDRTTQQTDYPAVVFSEELDTLQSPNELTSIMLYKNVAYVFSVVGMEIVYALDVDPSISGFERRALFLKINESDLPAGTLPAVASAQMIQKGQEELYKNRRFSAFDGELNQYSSYKYEQDYYLGDLVEMQNKDGVRNQMQVIEHISVSDEQGERSYPTLAIRTFVSPGSWLARPHDQYWADVPATEHWGDLP